MASKNELGWFEASINGPSERKSSGLFILILLQKKYIAMVAGNFNNA